MKITSTLLMFALVLVTVGCPTVINPVNEVIEITDDITWSGEMTISGQYRVNDGATLTVAAGSTIKADPVIETLIIVKQGGKLVAQGTVDSPIVFTSAKAVGARAPLDWGGIQILGRSTIPGGTSTAEGVDFPYGGTNDADNSGTLRYVRIEFAGRNIDSDNELNGLGLFGVGSGTTIEYVQLHNCQDDGVEPFGGTVNLFYIVATANGDDQIDCAAGWRGTLSNAIAVNINGGSSIEFDGNQTGGTTNSIVNVFNLLVVDNAGRNSDGYATLWRRGGIFTVTDSLFIGNGTNIDLVRIEDNGTVYSNEGSNSYYSEAIKVVSNEVGSAFNNTNNSGFFPGTTNLSFLSPSPLISFNIPTSIEKLAFLAPLVFSLSSNFSPNLSWADGWTAFPAN